jgi:hypothetical protein
MKREQKGTPLTPERVFIDHMLANTVRLVRNARHFPHNPGVASGFLVYREERPLLLTAGHIFTAAGPWTLETNLTSNEGVLHVALRDLQRIVSLDLGSGDLAEIDMAWASIDPEDVRAGRWPLRARRQGPLRCPAIEARWMQCQHQIVSMGLLPGIGSSSIKTWDDFTRSAHMRLD